MPTYYTQETTVQLSVASLEGTTTRKPATKQNDAVKEIIRSVTREFAQGSKDGTLTETSFFTEDRCIETHQKLAPSSMGFLGKNGTVPFFMVHAGNNFFDLTTKEDRNRSVIHGDFDNEPNRNYVPPRKPHALCLTVFLCNSSFVFLEDKATGRKGINDMKIDIYFNGALCESRFIPGQFYEEKDAMTEKMFHFTGRRIDRMIEKPWIIVPSDQNPDDPKEYRKDEAAYAGAQQRWKDISNALMTEADKNRRNDKGERPVIGEYLESLARLSMPKEVGDMQKAGGTKFGILDTVITWGKGRPEGGYIYETTPIRNEEFTAPILEQDMDLTPVQIVPKTTGSPSTAPKSKEDVSGKFFNAGLDAFTHLHPSLTPTRTTTPDVITDSSTSPQKKRPYANLQPEEPRKRYPGHDRVPLPKGPTLEEQFNPITAATDFDQNTGRSPFPMNNARTPASHSKGNSKKGGLQGWEYLAE